MPSMSASVPASQLKVMRGKPTLRKMPNAVSGVGMSPDMSDPANQAAANQAKVDSANLQTPNVAGVRGVPGAGAGVGGFGRPNPPMGVRGGLGGPGGLTSRGFPGRLPSGPNPGGGAGGVGDIQTAIQSLRGQLGQPTVGAGIPPGGAGGGDTPVESPGAPGAPGGKLPWQQLAEMGVGGQGSPAANRAKLAEILAARNGGGSSSGGIMGLPSGAEPGGLGAPGGPGGPGSPTLMPFARPGSVGGVGDAGRAMQMQMNVPDETGGAPQLQAQTANPYMDLLRQRGITGGIDPRMLAAQMQGVQGR